MVCDTARPLIPRPLGGALEPEIGAGCKSDGKKALKCVTESLHVTSISPENITCRQGQTLLI